MESDDDRVVANFYFKHDDLEMEVPDSRNELSHIGEKSLLNLLTMIKIISEPIWII